MSDKPEMYHNKLTKKINNNKEVYTSYSGNIMNKNSDIDIKSKINNIINSNTFIYSKLVNIVIGNNVLKKRIIGIDNNNLVTIDNEYIPLSTISDIYI